MQTGEDILDNEIDWASAPKGATHYSKKTGSFYKQGSGIYCIEYAGGRWHVSMTRNNYLIVMHKKPTLLGRFVTWILKAIQELKAG